MNSEQTQKRRGRPRKPVDDINSVKSKVIKSGLAALTEKGYSSVGLDEILKNAEIPKGSFYHYFSSKDDLASTLIRSYAEYFAKKLDRWFLDETHPPLTRLALFITDAQDGMARFGFRRGCLVGNLGQEMGSLPEIFREQLIAVFQDWQDRTATCLKAAQQRGDLAPHHDCAALAAFFWVGWEGAVLRAKLEKSPAPLTLFAQGFFAILGHSWDHISSIPPDGDRDV